MKIEYNFVKELKKYKSFVYSINNFTEQYGMEGKR